MQAVVTLGTNDPYDRVVGPISRSDPWRTLAALARSPGRDDRWRICRSNLVGLNLAASIGAKNKIRSLGGRVGGRRLTSHRSINTR
jgi:hypothetical protein